MVETEDVEHVLYVVHHLSLLSSAGQSLQLYNSATLQFCKHKSFGESHFEKVDENEGKMLRARKGVDIERRIQSGIGRGYYNFECDDDGVGEDKRKERGVLRRMVSGNRVRWSGGASGRSSAEWGTPLRPMGSGESDRGSCRGEGGEGGDRNDGGVEVSRLDSYVQFITRKNS